MPVVTSDFLEALRTNYRALFASSFAAYENQQDWGPLAMRMDSDSEQNSYNWLGTSPKMQKVTHGQVKKEDLPPFNFTIVNDEWQNAIEVERAALERDKLSLIPPRIMGLALEAARHPGELIMQLFVDNPVAFDNVTFFNDTRVIGKSANIDNIRAGTGVTVAAFQTDLGVARGVMRKFQDDQGRPMNLVGNVIVVPAELEQLAYQAINADQEYNAGVVPAAGAVSRRGYTILVNPFLSDANDWFLLHDGGEAARPFIYQTEKEPELLADTDPNTRAAIETRKFLYSGYGRYNAGVADPRFAVKTTNT
jgi:phage major head subunit gpT-like protein